MHRFKFILRAFFESIKVSVESFILPTGSYLIPSLIVSLVILVVVIISAIFNLPRILDIPGVALGVLLLGGILIIERSERSEVSNFYRTVTKSVQSVVGGKKRSASSETAEVAVNNTEESELGSRERQESSGPANDNEINDWCTRGDTAAVNAPVEEQDDRCSTEE